MQNNKKLDELTTAELGKLFPVQIVAYNYKWKDVYKSEADLILSKLGKEVALRIEHFGSTAVEGLSAKPTIDILVEIPTLNDALKKYIITKMQQLDYQFIWRTDDPVPYMNFVKGYTLQGFRGQIFHVHLGDNSHSLWDRLFFRDFLKRKPEVAKEYERLKIKLATEFKFDREAYTAGKTDFVNKITELAKNENSNRY